MVRPTDVVRRSTEPGGWIQWDEWYRNKENKVDMVKLAPSPRCDWALGAASKVFPE